MGYSFFHKIRFVLLFLCLSCLGFSQPFVDIVNTGVQALNTTYKDSLKNKNATINSFLNVTLPVVLDSQNTFIIRFYGEQLHSTIQNDIYKQTNNLYVTLLPIGWQHETKNKKWKILGLAMPRLSSDFKTQAVSAYTFQMGGYGLATYVVNPKLKIKAGLYYNREAFGNFFMPLAGVDWVINDRLQLYGVLPTSYRMEYALVKQKLYVGLAFKSFTRSYRLSDANHNYVKNVEIQAKMFVDFYIAKKFVLFAEFGRTIGYSPLAYVYDTRKTLLNTNPIYTKIQDAFFIQAGLAFRIRSDFK